MATHTHLLALALLISAVGDAEIETHRKSCATGSSILFPGLKSSVKFTEHMIYELRKVGASPGWLMMEHGEIKVQKLYETRGKVFPENKSFLLTNLMKEDVGVYEQKLNQRTLLRVILAVIDSVEEPVLRRQDDGNETCHISLLCAGWKRDSSNITFLRNGVEINRNMSSSDNLLVIDGTDPQHWGIYTCMLNNLVSHKVSQELVLKPKEVAGELLFFCVSCIGGFVYIYHLCLLCTINNKSPLLKNIIFYCKWVCGAGMELGAFSIIICLLLHLRDKSFSAARGIIVSVISVILLVRSLWSLMFCGLPLHSLIIMLMEDTLLAADLLLVPAVFIEYMRLYLQDSDLCEMKRQQRVWMLLYLAIGFVTLLAVVLPLRILWMKYRAPDPPDPPDPQKGLFIATPTEEITHDVNEGGGKNEESEGEAGNVEETPA